MEQIAIGLHDFFQVYPEGAMLLDPECRIIMVNEALCRLVGKQAHELVGKGCDALFPGKFCDSDRCPLEQLKGKVKSLRSTVSIDNGVEAQQVTVTATPVRDPAGVYLGVLELFHPLTGKSG